MRVMNHLTNQSLQKNLCSKGIILKSGVICEDKINLISGAMTASLIESVWIFSGYDTKAMERIMAVFTHLYNESREAEMMAILRILYDVYSFRRMFALITEYPEARQYFLFSFLLDMKDCMQDL